MDVGRIGVDLLLNLVLSGVRTKNIVPSLNDKDT